MKNHGLKLRITPAKVKNSITKLIVRIIIYVVFAVLITKNIFINAPDGEFFDNETNTSGIMDFMNRINYWQIFIVVVPVFLFVLFIVESIYYVCKNRIRRPR